MKLEEPQKQPTPAEWDAILNAPLPNAADLAARKEIPDLPLVPLDQKIAKREDDEHKAAIEATRRKIEELSEKK